jgi:transcriptional regulator GlxA family with amidase domain
MMSVVTAIEPLRMANRILGEERFAWKISHESGEMPQASNGLVMSSERGATSALDPDYTFVCAGLHANLRNPQKLYDLLHERHAADRVVGAISIAPTILASAGLLNGRRAVIHWEGRSAFEEDFPAVKLSDTTYEVDGKIMTSSGGLATLDLFLHIIEEEDDDWLAQAVTNQLQVGYARTKLDRKAASSFRLPATAPKLMHKAMAIMDRALASPLTPEEIAAEIGTSRRTLDRRFNEFTGRSVTDFYVTRRLEEALSFLRHSNKSITDIAMSTGFSSSSYFASVFKSAFGQTPRQFRNNSMNG